MKKILCFLFLIVFLLCGCSGQTGTPKTEGRNEKQQSSQKESESKSADGQNEEFQEVTKENVETPGESTVSSDTTEGADKNSSLAGKVIVVDAGHGLFKNAGQEAIAPGSSQTKPKFVSGTTGKNQTEEQLNLAVALKLKAALEKKGATVHMTRDTHETTLSNIDRAQFANDLGADMSVKLHADGSESPSLHGVSMLIPGTQHVDAAVVEKSTSAGEMVLDAVAASTGAENRGTSVRNDMTGFNWSTVPVILLEMGFMTNPEDDALLETATYQDKIVSGIVTGLEKYFG